MLTGMERITSRRAWFVPEVAVWGLPGIGDLHYLVVEDVNSVKSVLFGTSEIQSSRQNILYQDLVDHRGNHLPETIKSPKVLARSKSQYPVFVMGQETNTAVQLARSPDAPNVVTADLMIVEMGE